MKKPWTQLVFSLIAMIMIANLQYAWTLFVEPMRDARAWQLSGIQFAFSLFIVLQTWVQPLDGWFIDRFGPRFFVTVAGILCGLGWSAMGYAKTLPQLYFFYAMAGIGAAFVYSGSIGSALKWFPNRRGFASGLIAAGFGGGTALFVPIISYLIRVYNYQAAFLATGIFQGLTITIVAQFLRHPGPDFVPAKAVSSKSGAKIRRNTENFTTQEMLLFKGRIGRQTFWLTSLILAIVYLACWFLIRSPQSGEGPSILLSTLLILAVICLPVCVCLSIANAVKRWHDRGKPGWMVLIALIPVIGWVWSLVELGCLRGTAGRNQFGDDPVSSRPPGWTAANSWLYTSHFYILYVMFVAMSTGGLFVTANSASVVRSWGMTTAVLTTAAALSPLANGASRISWGWLSDRLGRENTMVIAFLLQAGCLVSVVTFGRTSGLLFTITLILTYFTWGEIYSLFPSTLGDYFGSKFATSNYGFLYTAKGVAAIIGGFLAAVLFEQFGSWTAVFYASAVLALISAVMAFFMRTVPLPKKVADQSPLSTAEPVLR